MVVVAINLATANLATKVLVVLAVKMAQKKKAKHANLVVKVKKFVVALRSLLHQIYHSVRAQNV
jgi:hypothetical protein